MAIFSILFGFVTLPKPIKFTLPTPFYKHPFEFIIGFRNTFFLYPLLYALTFVAVYVDNFNLGIASVLGVFVIVVSFYARPENVYYVWSFSSTPKQFIFTKLITALLLVSVLVLPPALFLLAFNFYSWHYLILFLAIGYLFLGAVIGAKYAAYPHHINIPQAFTLGLCIYFPPLLLVAIPYFLYDANKNLKHVLNDIS
ncbi:MAG TPA: hypothetical protein VK177_21540 [Flavobacteriales bacterium]|nr:hypothetical protein [Flavobacteriales bacterium]